MRNFIISSLVGLSVVTTPTTLSAQSLEEAKRLLDVWLAAQVDYNDWPSLSVAFVDDQTVVYENSFGYANRAKKVKATPDTLYSICSISKLFTSISVLQLRDAGKLSLRDPVGKHLDWYAIKQKYPLSDTVSIESILSHSSGLPREVDTPYWSGSEGFPFPARKKAIEITQGQETLYRAWEHFQYSNLGLTLAGEIVANVSGQDYHAYVRQNVLNPLGLTNTYSEMSQAKHGKELAVGYGAPTRNKRRDEIPYFNAEAIAPAAGFTSSARDLAKFTMWQLKLREGEGDKVLDHNTLREMQRPHSVINGWYGAFGLGFSIKNNDGGTLIGHGGSCPGYQTQVFLDPAKHTGGVALINAAGVDPAQVIDRMSSILGPVLKKAADKEDGTDDNAYLSDFEGTYDIQPWDDENYIMPWGEYLITVSLRSDNPMKSMDKLKHVEGDRFVRLRGDGTEAENVDFLRNAQGAVTGLKWHSTVMPKK